MREASKPGDILRLILCQIQQTTDSAPCTRRSFLKTSTVAVAGLTVADYGFAAPQTETLAMAGGGKTVNCPPDQFAALTKWPRYGEAEKQALCKLLDNNEVL